ncbi:MAG: SET domain-containing protein-lysine N-methyltransferase [Ferruginibacter sp.]|nr:SET domain-containing protein-lysine N-methyltransferase [Ferruginibacter sp.]
MSAHKNINQQIADLLSGKTPFGLKVCVLQPDYSTCAIDYQHYDPPRNLGPLIPEAEVEHVFLNKLTTYKQLKELSKKKFDVFVNLCEGYLEWEVPSIDVIYFLELLNLPFTGPNSILYDPSKELMKYVAYTQSVNTPSYVVIEKKEDLDAACAGLTFPLFVKPVKAGDSLGIDDFSLVQNASALKQKVFSILDEYGPLLIEEYIDGREFTVLVAGSANDQDELKVFEPIEYIFPVGKKFKTYSLKTSELHPDANIPVAEKKIRLDLKTSAEKIFNAFGGVGYARMDFRMDHNGKLFFLEINFTCSVFYSEGYEGSADYILKNDCYGLSQFLRHIIAEGIYRHQKKQKKYRVMGNSISGYGIYATVNLKKQDVIFYGEEKAQRIATRSHISKNWNDKEKENFRRYAYPICEEVFLLWDSNPSEWAPQNHSCDANTIYSGLNVIASRDIQKGEELTLDYASFLDEHAEPFQCNCGSSNCRKNIIGKASNNINNREGGK